MAEPESEVVFTTGDPYTAQVVRGALEAAGIPCMVAGEQQGGFVGLVPEISITVPTVVAEKARQLIADHPKQAGIDQDQEEA
jgi:hypothetical protein